MVEALVAYFSPLVEFLQRQGALVVLLFVLIHKIGDTLANLTLRLLFKDLGFTNDEVAFYDVGVGFVALLIGIFVGGILYARLGMKRSVLISLILMAVSNLSFAGAGGGRPYQRRHGCGDRLREFRERHRRRDGGRLPLRAVQPALHRDPVRAALRAGEHCRALPHRNHRGRR